MFKSILALSLILILTPISAIAQSLTADGCIDVAYILYGVSRGKDIVTKTDQIKEMKEALTGQPDESLIPFFEQKINEIYQSKQTPEAFTQEFMQMCFAARGDIKALMGKKI